jgi:O-antigen ligase
MDLYWMVGAFSALLSLISAVLLRAGIVNLYFVYGDDLRVRGFFNEAGPYGIFLVSVILVLLLRAHHFPKGIRLLRNLSLVLALLALFQSSSKAGFFAAAALCGAVGITAARNRQRMALISGCAVAGLVVWVMLGPQILNYVSDYSGFEDALTERGDDPSLIMGRIVGAILVPRMIAEHPVSGIGIGNYSLMRNDPFYLQGLPAVTEWDLPGLGLIGMTAELGIPLTVFLLVLLLRPLLQARKCKAPWVLLAVAAFQPIAVLVGVNANFFYPWLMSAFALSLLPPVSPRSVREAA